MKKSEVIKKTKELMARYELDLETVQLALDSSQVLRDEGEYVIREALYKENLDYYTSVLGLLEKKEDPKPVTPVTAPPKVEE